MSIVYEPGSSGRHTSLARPLRRAKLVLVGLLPLATAILIEPWIAAATILAMFWQRLDRNLPSEISSNSTVASVPGSTHRHPYVLNAASNLLGICLIIIGGLKLTNQSSKTYSDEVAWFAAFCMLASIVLSYTGLRGTTDRPWRVWLVDWSFLFGVGALIVSMLIAAYQL